METRKSKVITLNVGGIKYTTFESTLLTEKDSIFPLILEGKFSSIQQEDGSFFIDRNGKLFGYILNFLREQNLPMLSLKKLEMLEYEAQYYQLGRLQNIIHNMIETGVITLNIGGIKYTVLKSTLLKEKGSIFEKILEEDPKIPVIKLKTSSFFIDRDGKLFGYILNFLRSGNLPSLSIEKLKLLKQEANYYQIKILEKAIDDLQMEIEKKKDSKDVMHQKVICLNVGGIKYYVLKSILSHSSMLRTIAYWGSHPEAKQLEDGSFFIERDGTLFQHVLNFLKYGELSDRLSLKEINYLFDEANFYELEKMKIELTKIRLKNKEKYLSMDISSFQSLTRKTLDSSNGCKKEGITLQNYNLRGVIGIFPVYENIRFIECDFSDQNLTAISFSNCVFEDCDMTNTNIYQSNFKDCVFRKCYSIVFNTSTYHHNYVMQQVLPRN